MSPWSGLDGLGTIHLWLRNDLTGDIIDPTASQYEQLNGDPPYPTGKKLKWNGFRPFPQMRALNLIPKIQPDVERSKIQNLESLDG